MQDIEKKIATALVNAALKRGMSVTVFDGEETTLKRSTDLAAIMEALATTDHDLLQIKKQDGTFVGNVLLIWGNGEDLVSDSTTGEIIEELCKEAQDAATV